MSQHKNMSENMKLKGNSVNPGRCVDVVIDARESVNLLECDSLLLTPPTMRMNIKYKDLVYKIQDKRKKRTILDSVCGSIVPGELTAIIGPSGAGKSTLLDVLSGFK
uniref:ABC transporter G family member 22 (Trinotate prediction) n=1 Tax=Myxobolus squamalis TaxID=59785 RepID=A0A6B2G4N7_MYXSQ